MCRGLIIDPTRFAYNSYEAGFILSSIRIYDQFEKLVQQEVRFISLSLTNSDILFIKINEILQI